MTDHADIAELRAITFDLDFTLWDLTGVIHRAEEAQFEFLAANYPEIGRRYSSDGLRALRMELFEQRHDLRHNITELRKLAIRVAAQNCGYDDESLVEAAFNVFLDARHDVNLFEDTVPLLERLHGRYVLGVITNGNARVERLGLGEYFDFVLSPMDVGAAKPDRVIFEAACNIAGFEPEQVMHVGDEPLSDVIGAADYGMHAVWVNRDGKEWPEELEPRRYTEVDSLTGLGRMLGVELA